MTCDRNKTDDWSMASVRLLAGLKRPDLLTIITAQDETGTRTNSLPETSYGCDQEWYGESWQRRAGCGPCTSATVLLYLSRQQPELTDLYPSRSPNQKHFIVFMEKIWHYVTPGIRGVNEPSMLINGLQAYARSRSIDMEASVFMIPDNKNLRQPFPEFIGFLVESLDRDCPVAFLNLSNGKLENLDSWHWVTITGVFQSDSGLFLAEISDSGERKRIDLELWYRTSRLGGAAVSFFAAARPKERIGVPVSDSAD